MYSKVDIELSAIQRTKIVTSLLPQGGILDVFVHNLYRNLFLTNTCHAYSRLTLETQKFYSRLTRVTASFLKILR